MDTFCLEGLNDLSEYLFELTKFEILDRFYYDLIVNAQGTKKFVQISESWNYRVFELTKVGCGYKAVFSIERLLIVPNSLFRGLSAP